MLALTFKFSLSFIILSCLVFFLIFMIIKIRASLRLIHFSCGKQIQQFFQFVSHTVTSFDIISQKSTCKILFSLKIIQEYRIYLNLMAIENHI